MSEFLPIRQVNIHSRCKGCRLNLIDGALLERVNTDLANGVRHKQIIEYVAAWAQEHAEELTAEERDRCRLTPNNLSRHKRHITREVEAVRDLERTRALMGDIDGTDPLSRELSVVRLGMGLTHRELLGRSLSEIDSEKILREARMYARAAADLAEAQSDAEETDEQKLERALRYLRAHLTAEQVQRLHDWLVAVETEE